MKKILKIVLFIIIFAVSAVGTKFLISNVLNNGLLSKIKVEEFATYGATLTKSGQEAFEISKGIDCEVNTYSWVNKDLSCTDGKKLLENVAKSEESLGEAYKVLSDKNVTKEQVQDAIKKSEIYLKNLQESKKIGLSLVEIAGQIKTVEQNADLLREQIK